MAIWLNGLRNVGRVVGAILPAAFLAGVFVLRAGADPGGPNPAAGAQIAPADRLTAAADGIEARLGPSGNGFTFTVVSRSTFYARPDGPRIEVPDPADPRKVAGLADSYYLGADIAMGIVTADGYFLQMYAGPATPDAAPDFKTAPTTLATLVKGGTTWRNDGDGWYETDQPPGIGLDPATIALLPKLLRDASAPVMAEARSVDGATASVVEAAGDVADAPGLMAVDAASFTELAAPLSFAFDDQGRLVEIRALMRNTRMETYDLLVETVITITYPDARPTLPDPSPLKPADQPASDGGTAR